MPDEVNMTVQDRVLMVGEPPPEVLALRDMFSGDGLEMKILAQPGEARRFLEEGPPPRLLLLLWTHSQRAGDLLDWMRRQPGLEHLGIVVLSEEAPEELPENIGSRTFLSLLPDSGAHQLQSLTRAILANADLRHSLKCKVEEVKDCFRLLSLGTFHLRTQAEAELLAAHFGSAAGDPQLGICVMELLLNSIEHGNLQISYDEKSQLLEEGRFHEEVARRLASEEYRDRRVLVELKQLGGRLELMIEDCGGGFDYGKYLDLDAARILDRHGRGILMANALLDLEYVHPGNRVRVVLPLGTEDGYDARRFGV